MQTAKQNKLGLKTTDNVSAMLSYWDKDLVCRFANSAFFDWFGKTKESMMDNITLEELLGQSLFERNLPQIDGALNGTHQMFQREIPLPSGIIRNALTRYYPDIVNGEVKGFFVHVTDITQLKLLENELITTNDKLEDHNNRLLNYSNIFSHNLKSYSDNLASILSLYNASSSDDEKNKMMGFLMSISEGFSLTVNNLNEIAKSQNLSKLDRVRVNLNKYVEKCKETLFIQIDSTNAIVNNNIDVDTEILATPAYIDSILLNLLTNAIKYRQPNIPPVIEITSCKKADKTILKIKDNGQGINLEKHNADLFGMYKTFHGNTDAEGLGLFLTKYQVEAMGGQIEVTSKVNIGTTFTITFSAIQN